MRDLEKQKKAQHESYLRNKETLMERQRQRRINNRRYVSDYLKAHQCVDCNEDDWIVLEFDHIGEKTGGISYGVKHWVLSRLQEEISRCEVVCANCHRRRTYTRTPCHRVG
jgi:transcription elongation factor Elf1